MDVVIALAVGATLGFLVSQAMKPRGERVVWRNSLAPSPRDAATPPPLPSRVAAPPPPVQTPAVQTVEQTAKQWKGMMLTGGLLMLGSPVACVAAVATKGNAEAQASAGGAGLIFLLGLALFVYARIMAWWHHG